MITEAQQRTIDRIRGRGYYAVFAGHSVSGDVRYIVSAKLGHGAFVLLIESGGAYRRSESMADQQLAREVG